MLEVHGKSLGPHFRQTAHQTGNQGIDHSLSLPQRKTPHLLTVICYIKVTTNRKENRRREGQEILITAEQTSIILT